MNKPFIGVLGAALLGGCSLLPDWHQADYQRPAAPVPAAWPQAGGGERAVQGLTLAQMFPDPRLRALLAAALDNNRDLRIAVGRVSEARALLGGIAADRLPTVNLGASASAARLPADLSGVGSARVNRRDDISVGVTAFELDFWGRVQRLDEAARASYLATAAARDAFRLALIADVASAYLTWQELGERLQLARAALDNRKDFLFLAEKRRDVGLAGDLDVRVAQAALETIRAQVADLQRRHVQAANALVLLVGQAPENLPDGWRLRQQNLPLDLKVEAPAAVLLNRPDVRAAEQRLIAAHANIGAARAAFLPRVTLSLALGTASRGLDGLFGGGSGVWSFVPALTQPLFDAGRREANVDLARARAVIAVADYEKAIQQGFREVADLLVARDKLAGQLVAQEAAETAQRQRLALVEARYQTGVTTALEWLDAQRDVYAAEQATVQARAALLATAAGLYKALGGD